MCVMLCTTLLVETVVAVVLLMLQIMFVADKITGVASLCCDG